MHFKDKATENPHIKLRTTVISDLETLFVFQRDKEAVRGDKPSGSCRPGRFEYPFKRKSTRRNRY